MSAIKPPSPPDSGNIVTPCGHRQPVDGANTLVELPLHGKINLRGNADDAAFTAGIEAALALRLPLEPNSLTRAPAGEVYWLGPDEWRLNCELQQVVERLAQLQQALRGVHSACVDVSDYYTTLRLQGEDAAALLARGSPLDLHERVFAADRVAQTRFGHAGILLHKRKPLCFDLQVRWSFAEYVWDYLLSGLKTSG